MEKGNSIIIVVFTTAVCCCIVFGIALSLIELGDIASYNVMKAKYFATCEKSGGVVVNDIKGTDKCQWLNTK